MTIKAPSALKDLNQNRKSVHARLRSLVRPSNPACLSEGKLAFASCILSKLKIYFAGVVAFPEYWQAG